MNSAAQSLKHGIRQHLMLMPNQSELMSLQTSQCQSLQKSAFGWGGKPPTEYRKANNDPTRHGRFIQGSY